MKRTEPPPGYKMQASDSKRACIGADDHEMLAIILAAVFFRSARLIPRRAQDAPAQIEIIFHSEESAANAAKRWMFSGISDYPDEKTKWEVDLMGSPYGTERPTTSDNICHIK